MRVIVSVPSIQRLRVPCPGDPVQVPLECLADGKTLGTQTPETREGLDKEAVRMTSLLVCDAGNALPHDA